MTGNERPDIYADGLREERCENCLHCCATVLRTVHGVERTEYECGRRPEFVHSTQWTRQVQLLDRRELRDRGGLMAIIEMPKGVTPSTIPEYATPNEWAEAFNVSLRTVYRMCKDGELMTVRTPGSIRICRDMSFVLLGLDR